VGIHIHAGALGLLQQLLEIGHVVPGDEDGDKINLVDQDLTGLPIKISGFPGPFASGITPIISKPTFW